MDIKISNYRNIKEANLNIENDKIKIIFSLSGVGKTAIAEAIREKHNNIDFTQSWLFKEEPEISIFPHCKNVIFYNEKSKEDFVFETEDHKKGVYNVVSSGYSKKKIKEISLELLEELNKIYKEIENIGLNYYYSEISNFTSLMMSGKKDKLTHLSIRNGRKKLYQDNKEEIKNLIESRFSYVDWIKNGKNLYEINKKCAYCFNEDSSNVPDIDKPYVKADLRRFEDAKSSPLFKDLEILTTIDNNDKDEELKINLNELKLFVSSFEKFWTPPADSSLFINELSSFNNNFLIEEIYIPNVHLKKLPKIEHKILSINKMINKLNNLYKINLEKILNEKETIEKTLSENIEEINFLLKKLQLDFTFKINGFDHGNNDISYELEYTKNNKISTEEIKKTLSFGEKNIIALILTILNKEADAFVLDDPLSSYDDFRRGIIMFEITKILKELKVPILILTHDEYFIRKILFDNYLAKHFEVEYLTFDYNNKVEFKKIKRKDFIGINENFLKDDSLKKLPLLLKIIRLRQYVEIYRKNDEEYNDLWNWLCDLIKVRKDSAMKFLDNNDKKLVPLPETIKKLSFNEYKSKISNDNFYETLTSIFTKEELKMTNQEIIFYLREINNYKIFDGKTSIVKLLIIKNIASYDEENNYFKIKEDKKPSLEPAKDIMHLVNSPFKILNFEKISIIRYPKEIEEIKISNLLEKNIG